jgi:hypothetical protein
VLAFYLNPKCIERLAITFSLGYNTIFIMVALHYNKIWLPWSSRYLDLFVLKEFYSNLESIILFYQHKFVWWTM